MSDGSLRNGDLPPSGKILHNTHLTELLDQDWRPSFILDVNDQTEPSSIQPVFCNAILASSLSLKEALFGRHDGKTDQAYVNFKTWATRQKWSPGQSYGSLKATYRDLSWSASYVQGRWKVIRGEAMEEALRMSRFSDTPFLLGADAACMPLSFGSKGLSLDGLARTWINHWDMNGAPASSCLVDSTNSHIQFFQDLNWADTPLGSNDLWPERLQAMIGILLADPSPCVLFWGPDFVMIYNEAYVPLLGSKHPEVMGMPGRLALPEVWDQVATLLSNGISTRQPVMVEDMLFHLVRSEHLEETYFRSTFMPLMDENESVVGFYESVIETTNQIVSRRREELIEIVEGHISTARSPEGFWMQVAETFQDRHWDILLVSGVSFVQSVTLEKARIPVTESGSVSDTFAKNYTAKVWRTEDSGSKLSPLHNVRSSVISAFENVALSGKSTTLSSQMVSDYELLLRREQTLNTECMSSRATILIYPVVPDPQFIASDFIMLVVNPERPYDRRNQLFIEKLAALLTNSFVALFIDQKRSEQERALALELKVQEYRLAEEMRLRALAAQEEERKFTRLAKGAPVGICVGRLDGTFTFRNDMWFQITGWTGDSNEPFSWSDMVHESHQPALDELLKSVLQWNGSKEPEPNTAEVKLKRVWNNPNQQDRPGEEVEEPHHVWLLVSVQPNEFDSAGNVDTLISVLTDISHQKWVEGDQARRVKDALKAKQQQQDFVDIVSHEIRNPLGAVLISAEEIQESARDMLAAGTISEADAKTHIEATGIIISCVQHQKRIVDDILSLSRMDADLLNVALVRAQPVLIAQEAIKLLSPQAQSADVTTDLKIDRSIKDLQVQWVFLDPSRLTQVLVNLITNAIKFTRGRPRRRIRVEVKASTARPSSLPYISGKSRPSLDIKMQNDVYIEYIVHDTGRGLTQQEQKALFQRFSQASSRTFTEYGGSGLGLFISRVLVEKQGGEIGVASESGVGSQFGFYILARIPTDSENSTPVPTENVADKSAAGGNQALSRAINVLLVEDNLINQKVFGKQLRQRGCVVHVANNGLEALNFIESSAHWHQSNERGERLSIILMDQEMPVMDGITCVRKIRQWEEKGWVIDRLPVIGVTANARPQQVEHLKSAGMDDVVLKPFRVPELMDQMARVILAQGSSKDL